VVVGEEFWDRSGDDRAVLLAIIGGASGELSAQLAAGVGALVRRPFHGQAPGDTTAAGEAELRALECAASDEGRAVALAEVLMARADADAEPRSTDR